MGLIIGSIFFLALGLFVFFTSVNYAWVLWEKERVDNLTKQIKPNEEVGIFKRNQSREYTQSFDIKAMGKSGVNRAQQAYEKTMVAISDGNYPGWVTRAIEIFEQTRKDFFTSIRQFIAYLIHLAKPDETDDEAILHEELKEQEVEQVISRVKDTNTSPSQSNPQLQVDATMEDDYNDPVGDAFHSSDTSPIRVTLNNQNHQDRSATIALSKSNNSKVANAVFEKLEARILDKLKQSGLNHYSVWIELGELYVKFDEKEKASEVFALVLKNTKDEKEKELARNRLISL